MVSVPVPALPTVRVPLLCQLEPAPVTVTVPSPPAKLPTVPPETINVPPVWIVSDPVLD